MRLYSMTISLIVIVMTGCTHMHTMTPETPSEFYDRINDAAGGQTVMIRLGNGDERLGANVRVTADSVVWLVPDVWTRQFTEPRGVPISDVNEMVIVNRTRGGLIGFGLGAIAGFGFGTIPAAVNARRGGAKAGTILSIGGLFALAGGVGGAVAGARKGEKDTFIFSEFLKGSDTYRLSQQLKGALPGVTEVLDRLRRSIRGIEIQDINEKITETNIVYISNERQFCYLIVRARDVQIYLSVKPGSVSDPMGLLRPWSSGDSWFSLVPGGDVDYAISLIRQAYRHTL